MSVKDEYKDLKDINNFFFKKKKYNFLLKIKCFHYSITIVIKKKKNTYNNNIIIIYKH